MKNLLEINHLSVSFKNGNSCVNAVRDLSLTVKRGEILGLVGESGSGKSVTAMSVAGLIKNSKKTVVDGRIFFNEQNLLLNQTHQRAKAQQIAMIFQDPVNSLNPSFTIGEQIREVFMVQNKMDKSAAKTKSVEMLNKVNIPSPKSVARQYPHQLSGGMCQRVMIAIALAANPELLIADEPTTALDVTIQAQILQLLHRLYHTTKTAILFITHDLGIIAQFCHTVAIMLEGQIVEKGPVTDIFKNPLHPYTKGLINSIPVLGSKQKLISIPCIQDEISPGDYCRFYSRCEQKNDLCKQKRPDLIEMEAGHFTRCHNTETGTML